MSAQSTEILPEGWASRFARVSGKFIAVVADAADLDQYPDGAPVMGSVIFTPNVKSILSTLTNTIFLPRSVEVPIKADGTFEVYLLPTDIQELNPVNWNYTVSYKINGGTIDSHPLDVPSGADIPLIQMIPVDTDVKTGTVILQGPRGNGIKTLTLDNAGLFTLTTDDGQNVSKNIRGPIGVTGVQGPPGSSGDLVANGFCSSGDRVNFSQFSLDKVDTPTGTGGSFYVTGPQASPFIDAVIPFNIKERYRFSFYAKQKTAGATGKMYGFIAPIDAWGNRVGPSQYVFEPSTTTTLAADLKDGDTTIKLTSSANWKKNASTPSNSHERSMIIWNWKDPGGKVWPEHTYSRNPWKANLWAEDGIDHATNTITLTSPWSGGSFPAGTPVSNGGAGGNFLYMPSATNVTVPEAWTYYTDVFAAGAMSAATAAQGRMPAADWSTGVPPGTAAVKVGWLLNYGTTPGVQGIAGVSLMPITKHDHEIGDVNGLQAALNSKSASNHKHLTADITDIGPAAIGAEPKINAGTTGQYYRGDKSWQVLDKSAVGLGSVDNTADINKPVSNPTQAALDLFFKNPIQLGATNYDSYTTPGNYVIVGSGASNHPSPVIDGTTAYLEVRKVGGSAGGLVQTVYYTLADGYHSRVFKRSKYTALAGWMAWQEYTTVEDTDAKLANKRDLLNPMGSRLKSATQTINTIINTKVVWDVNGRLSNVTWDSGTNEFVIQKAGAYLCNAQVQYPYYNNSNSLSLRHIHLYLNNTRYATNRFDSNQGAWPVQITRCIQTLSVGDRVSINVEHSAGGPVNLETAGSFFEIIYQGI